MATDSKALDTFPGARYWKSMQGAVDAILTPMSIQRRVISTGTQFVNYDAWTGEAFAHKLCDFFAANPDRVPTRTELTKLLDQANGYRCRDPHIRVARMPDRVTLRVARAIIGGGYHEAWHTKYSKRDRVRRSEVQPILDIAEQVTLAGGQFDAKMRGLLMTLHHLVEDIRIERRGNEDFEGAKQAMVDLQDFILDLEAAGREKGAKVKNVTVSMNARSIMLCAFRDLGLGYNSHKARRMIDFYKTHAPGAVALLAPGGLLAPMLHEAKTLERDDKMGSLRVAMKIVVELWRVTQQEPDEQEDEGMKCPQCGAGPKDLIIRSVKNDKGVKVKGRAELECKACGFKHEFDLPDNSLNLNQQEDEKEEDEDREKPEIEDLDNDDVGNGADGFGDDAREQMRDQQEEQNQQGSSQSSGGGETEDSEDDDEGNTQSSDGSSQANEGEEEGEGDDSGDESDGPEFDDLNGLVNDEDEDDEDGDDEESASSSGSEDDSDSDEAEGAQGSSEGQDDDGASSSGDTGDDDFDDAGGDQGSAGNGADEDGDQSASGAQSESQGDEDSDEDSEDGDEVSGDSSNEGSSGGPGDSQEAQDGDDEDGDWEMSGDEFEEAGGAGGFTQDLGRDYKSDLREAMEIFKGDESDGVMTNQSALDEALADQNRQELKDVQHGERVWNPMNPMLDEARIVRPQNPADSLDLANTMLTEVRSTVAYLGARLRTIVKAQEMNAVAHGVRRGRKLSHRTLVDTAIDIRSGRMPNRAYQTKDAKVDTSIDMAICLDQSSSMDEIQYQVAQVQMILAESVERIGGGTFAFGFRNGPAGGHRPNNWRAQYHRTQGIRYDVFKTWDEKFTNVKARFAHTLAVGTTPMSDGVQFGLMALEGRRAAHRVLAVITDGRPDTPHSQVILRQIRIAREAGIQVIGIGIGHGAKYVFDLFGQDNAVWSATVQEMPNELLKKLNELCDFSGRFRGRRPKLDGKNKMSRKVS